MIVQFTDNQIEVTLAALHHYLQKTGLSDVTMNGRSVTGLSHLDVIHGITVALRNASDKPKEEESKQSADVVPINGEDTKSDDTVTPS